MRVTILPMLLLLAGVARAQDAAPGPGQDPAAKDKEDRPTKLWYDDYRFWTEGGENVILLTGRPSVEGRGMLLKADSMIAWSPATQGQSWETGIEALYAEGNVVFEQEGMRLTLDRMYYDLKEHKAWGVNVVTHGWDSARSQPVVIRAREAREIAKGRIILDSATLTTCPYAARHYDFSLSELDLRFVEDEEGHFGKKYHGEASNVLFRVGGIPLFYLPYAAFDDDDDPLLRSLKAGKTSRFGMFALSDWGAAIRKRHIDRLNPFDDGNRDDDNKKWGDLTFEFDVREKRGYAYGLDLDYGWNDYWGFLDTYYLRDKGPDPTNKFDRQFIPMESKDRGRVRMFHRQELSPTLRGEAELSWLSDRHLLQEFFRSEYQGGKEQETVVYLRWKEENRMATFLERHRLNDFQTQNEYLPALSFAMLAEPVDVGPAWIADRLLFSTESQLAQIRRVYDDDVHIRPRQMWRFDTWNDIALPIDLEYLTVTPFAGARLTYYEEDLENESLARVIGSAGVRTETNIHRTRLGWKSQALGMDGLRHVVTFSSRYAGNYYSKVEPEELYFFDNTEDLGEFEELSFELRNRFLTRVKSDGKLTPHEFLSLGLGLEIYPDRHRDTGRLNRQNFLPPFNWMTSAPDETGTFRQRAHSNVYWDVVIAPKDYLSLTMQGEYNTDTEKEETRDFSIILRPVNFLSLFVDQHFLNRVTKGTSYRGYLKIGDGYAVDSGILYDYETKNYIKKSTTLSRDFHDFLVEVTYETDYAREDRRFLIAVTPKFLGGKRLGSTRSEEDFR